MKAMSNKMIVDKLSIKIKWVAWGLNLSDLSFRNPDPVDFTRTAFFQKSDF